MCKELGLIIKNEKVVVSSLDIGKYFDKEHYLVLRNIDSILDKKPELTDDFFIVSNYKDESGKTNKLYLMNRDGFTLVAMGFTTSKALEFKIKYIEAFNKMESYIREKQSKEWLQTRKQGKLVRRNETDNLKLLLEYAIKNGSETYLKQPNRLYSQYTRLVNGSVGIATGEREICTWKVLITIQMLEDMIQNTVIEEINKNTEYHEIYQICKNRCKEMIKYAYLPEQKLLK